MRIRGFLPLVAAVLLPLMGCHRNHEPVPGRLSAFEEDYFRTLFSFHPTLASAAGLHQFDGRLDNINPVTVSRRIDELTRMLPRLQMLRKGGLSPREKLDADLIDGRIRSELLDLKHRELWRHDPLLYLDIPLRAIRRMMRRRYAAASVRLNSIVLAVNQTEAVLASMRANVTSVPPEYSARALEECHRLQLLFQEELPGWARPAAGVDMRLLDSFNQSLPLARQAVATSMAWLKTEMVPALPGEFALRRDPFVMKLLFDGMVEIPLARLRSLAEENLQQDSRQFTALARRWKPGQTPAAVARWLAQRSVAPAHRVETARQALAAVRAFLGAEKLVPLPEKLPAIEIRMARPPFVTPLALGRVSLPALLGRDPATGGLYLGAALPDWPAALKTEFAGQWTAEQIQLDVIHDLVPGRYLQVLHARRYPSRAGRLLGSRLTAEGWGAYAERMMVGHGYGAGDPKLRLTALQRALVRDCRLVAAIRLHTEGATIGAVTRLFERQAFLGPRLAKREAVRGAYDPGYLAGALGRMLILRLRRDYRAVQGAAYSLGRFHAAFLAQGRLPIPQIRRALLPKEPAPRI